MFLAGALPGTRAVVPSEIPPLTTTEYVEYALAQTFQSSQRASAETTTGTARYYLQAFELGGSLYYKIDFTEQLAVWTHDCNLSTSRNYRFNATAANASRYYTALAESHADGSRIYAALTPHVELFAPPTPSNETTLWRRNAFLALYHKFPVDSAFLYNGSHARVVGGVSIPVVSFQAVETYRQQYSL